MSPMIINNLNSFGTPLIPLEDDAPLFVDPNAVRTPEVAFEGLEPVSRRRPQVLHRMGGVYQIQLSNRDRSDVRSDASCLTGISTVE